MNKNEYEVLVEVLKSISEELGSMNDMLKNIAVNTDNLKKALEDKRWQ